MKGKIVGVVKDIKIGSARDIASPVLFFCGLPVGGIYSLVIEVEDHYSSDVNQSIITFVEQRLNIDLVETQLVKNNYLALYQAENKLVQMVAIFLA